MRRVTHSSDTMGIHLETRRDAQVKKSGDKEDTSKLSGRLSFDKVHPPSANLNLFALADRNLLPDYPGACPKLPMDKAALHPPHDPTLHYLKRQPNTKSISGILAIHTNGG
ncbi:hypothetical protein TNIN_239181 [Trichonephila inaurata madagascariensis]|uniref:Uncharacterized protein n=1 Tax=Trichonephila inaurata madagascariensis TaxID=2747483 RepID=A0A8X6Y236_9ARAC|nr:hypothetical protein TNIN_239181 [Trichonephila inaurata madagascariensis]